MKKEKFVLIGGPFYGRGGAAYLCVTEVLKKKADREYRYSRISDGEFRYDNRWRKSKGSKDEAKGISHVRPQDSTGTGRSDGCTEGQQDVEGRRLDREGAD